MAEGVARRAAGGGCWQQRLPARALEAAVQDRVHGVESGTSGSSDFFISKHLRPLEVGNERLENYSIIFIPFVSMETSGNACLHQVMVEIADVRAIPTNISFPGGIS